MRTLVALLFLGVGSGCSKPMPMNDWVDYKTFHHLGGTVFQEPEIATMKEIHLDNGGDLIGKLIVVEGAVAEISDHFTYLVLSDSTARMMVVLTEMDDAEPILTELKPQIMKILGTVETGRKGRPLIMAKSINVIKDPEKA
jgi:hypothetical protein